MATRKSPIQAGTRAKTSSSPKAPKRAVAAPVKSAAATPVSFTLGATQTPDPSKLKHKLVRDSFTIPKSEYTVLGELKQRAARLARPVKKSELLRAGIVALSAMTDKSFLSALDAVPSLKTGRPKNDVASAGETASKKT
jgi:hypothetical protein